tara:strand:+ start:157 stop:345 length:189 start_codon:yes stop_codon:yes gene_type:complete
MNIHTNLTRPYWIVKKIDGTYIDKGKIQQGQNVTTERVIMTYSNKSDWLDDLVILNIDITDL